MLESASGPDAAVVTEPTDLQIAIGHKGFAWLELQTYGKAAHGSRPDEGRDAILAMCEQLVAIGVYPFVVPFVPASGTPLADHPAPDPVFMRSLLQPLGAMLVAGGLRSADIKAGCGRCGACSSLSSFER